MKRENFDVITQKLRAALAENKKVVSRALGWVGTITRVDEDGWVNIKSPRGTGAVMLLSAAGGDPLEVIEKDGVVIVQNPDWTFRSGGWTKDASERPGYDEAAIRRAVESIFPKIEAWFINCGELDIDRDRLIEQMIDIVPFSLGGCDGYSIARSLDDAGITPDDELVSILSRVPRLLYEDRDRRIEAWVVSSGIKPFIRIGEPAEFTDNNNQKQTGEVIGISEKRGTYTIFCESLGHVRKGLGTQGIIVSWEDAYRPEEVASGQGAASS